MSAFCLHMFCGFIDIMCKGNLDIMLVGNRLKYYKQGLSFLFLEIWVALKRAIGAVAKS